MTLPQYYPLPWVTLPQYYPLPWVTLPQYYPLPWVTLPQYYPLPWVTLPQYYPLPWVTPLGDPTTIQSSPLGDPTTILSSPLGDPTTILSSPLGDLVLVTTVCPASHSAGGNNLYQAVGDPTTILSSPLGDLVLVTTVCPASHSAGGNNLYQANHVQPWHAGHTIASPQDSRDTDHDPFTDSRTNTGVRLVQQPLPSRAQSWSQQPLSGPRPTRQTMMLVTTDSCQPAITDHDGPQPIWQTTDSGRKSLYPGGDCDSSHNPHTGPWTTDHNVLTIALTSRPWRLVTITSIQEMNRDASCIQQPLFRRWIISIFPGDISWCSENIMMLVRTLHSENIMMLVRTLHSENIMMLVRTLHSETYHEVG